MTGTTITRGELLTLGRAGDAYAFVRMATAALEQLPGDDELRLLLVQRLAELGLLRQARRVAERVSAAVAAQHRVADLIQRLSSRGHDGVAGWERLSHRFDANLERLSRRGIDVGPIRAAFDERRATLELHRTTHGVWQVLDVSEGEGRWRPAFIDSRTLGNADALTRQLNEGVPPPLVLDGVGLGDGPLLLYDMTQRHPLGVLPFLYIVEPDLLSAAIALHLHDWRKPLADERVVCCLGRQAIEALADAIRRRPTATVPRSRITFPGAGACGAEIDRVLTAVQAERDARLVALRADVESAYAGRDAAWWHRRFREALDGGGRPLRVLAMTSRYTTVLQYSSRDACRALRDLGCEVRLLIEPDAHSIIAADVALAKVRDFEPDLLFLIDHTRRTQAARAVDGLPVLTWIQDRLTWLFDPAAGRAMGPLDFCMGLGAEELICNFCYPRHRFFPCDMATCPTALSDEADDGADLFEPAVPDGSTAAPYVPPRPVRSSGGAYTCDVAFATHASEPPERFVEAAQASASDPLLRRVMQATLADLLARRDAGTLNGALDFERLLNRVTAAAGAQVDALSAERFISTFARPLADRILRQQTIHWVASWVARTGRTLHLYGNGWERHPEFAPHARGPLPHGVELGRAFRGASINLHAGLNTAFHQRVLDGLAAGGFFLIRRHGGDVSLEVSRALFDVVCRDGVRAPVAVRASDLPPPMSAAFRRLRIWKGIDPDEPLVLDQPRIDAIRRRFEAGSDLLPQMLWPEFEAVTFECEQEFVEKAERFVNDPAQRRRLADQMRQPVVELFGYQALLNRVIHWMANELGRSQVIEDRKPHRRPAEVTA